MSLKCQVAHQTTAHTMRLANVMKVLGWERTSNGKVTINGQQVARIFPLDRIVAGKEESAQEGSGALLMRRPNDGSAMRFKHNDWRRRFPIADLSPLEVGCQ